jgi:hypothetical protein
MLLKHFGKEKKDIAEAFYQVRNMIVHNFRSIASLDKYNSFLINIIRDFEKVIVDLLSYYREPAEDEFGDLPLAWLIYKANLES